MSIILFDTETTGLQPGSICQLSYILADRDKTEGYNYFFSVDYIEPASQAVHGLSVEQLAVLSGGKTFEEQYLAFREHFAEAEYLVAHNFVFDMLFMMAEYRKAGDVFKYKNKFCTMKHFQPICKFLNKRGLYKYPRLDELLQYYAVTPDEVRACAERFYGISATAAHDARYDTAALYCLLKAADRVPTAKTEDLRFGEYK